MSRISKIIVKILLFFLLFFIFKKGSEIVFRLALESQFINHSTVCKDCPKNWDCLCSSWTLNGNPIPDSLVNFIFIGDFILNLILSLIITVVVSKRLFQNKESSNQMSSDLTIPNSSNFSKIKKLFKKKAFYLLLITTIVVSGLCFFLFSTNRTNLEDTNTSIDTNVTENPINTKGLETTIQGFYVTSKEDRSLYWYNLDTKQLNKVLEGGYDTFGIDYDNNVYFIKDGYLFLQSADKQTLQTIYDGLNQPVSKYQKIVTSADGRYIVYATTGERYGAGTTSQYWIIDRHSDKTTKIASNVSDYDYITGPEWFGSSLIFATHDAYIFNGDCWEYIIPDDRVERFNPINLKPDSQEYRNFECKNAYSPNNEWVTYEVWINDDNILATKNLKTDQVQYLPEQIQQKPYRRPSTTLYSRDSRYLGTSTKVKGGTDLLLYDLTEEKIIKTHHLDKSCYYTLLDVSYDNFIYIEECSYSDLEGGTWRKSSISDTVASKIFEIEWPVKYLGVYNKNFIVSMKESVYSLNTRSGETTQLSEIPFKIDSAFVMNE